MNWQYTPYVFPLLIATAISTWLAFYSWKRRSTVGAMPFALLMLAVAGWSLGYTLELGGADLPTQVFWAKVEYLGIVVVPTAWLAFVIQYTGRGRWLTSRNVAVLTIEPLVVLLLVWTNEWHGLYWSDIGLDTSGSFPVLNFGRSMLFWVHTAYSYLLLLLGTFLLVQAFIRSPHLYRGQAGVLLIGALAPWVGNAVYILDLNPFFHLDLTPFAFTLTGLTVAWGLFRFRLFDIVPMARSAVVYSMSDGMVALDLQNRIVDLNPAAEKIMGWQASEVIGQSATRVLANRLDLVERYRDVNEAHAEIALGEGEAQRSYDLRIAPLYDQSDRLMGRLIVLRDITEREWTEAGLMAQKQLSENLVAMARAAVKHPSLEATLQSALNMAAALTGAEHGSIFLLDGTGAVTHSILPRGETPSVQQQDILRTVMKEGLAGWVVHHRQPALIPDTSRDDRWQDLPDAPYTARSALAIPIVSGSAVLGVLTLMHSAPSHFSTEHAYLIQAAADQMTLAVRNAQMYDEQRRLADRQTTLYEALRTVGEHLDLETVAHAAVEAVARLTGWPAIAILLPDDAHGATVTHLVVHAGTGALSADEGQRLAVDQGITGRAFRTAQTQHVPDVNADPDYVRGNSIIGSELAVPLRPGERVLGVLDVVSDRTNAFTDDDLMLARSLAEAIALALDNARLYAEIRQYAADLSALYTIARTISRSLVLEDVLLETLHSALTSLGFDASLICLADLSDDHLYLAAERGLPPAISSQLRQEGLEGTLCAYIHDRGEAVMVSDIEQETPTVSKLEKETPLAVSEMRAWGMRTYSGIPLLYRERSIGTLGLFARQPRPPSAEDQGLQMAIGRQVATAVTNARLFQVIEDERSRLQALIESNRDGIILIGMDQCILVVNAPALSFLRLTGQPEDWVNRPIHDALAILKRYSPDVVQIILSEMDRVQTGDELPGEGEFEVPPRTIHWLNLPVTTGTTLLGRLLVLRDVTEEWLLVRMRDNLVHTMVHDLRNPLTVISGTLTFLNESVVDVLSPSQRQLWGIAHNSTEGMLQLVNAILEMSRLESREMPLEHTLISLADLATDVLYSQLPLATEKSLHLENDVPADLPLAWADAGLIKRVLQNLVGNAVKFTPAGGVIRVTASADASDQSRLLVSVTDTGSGIPPEMQDRLFQKFVTGPHEGRGSGLGLAFCKMVVEAHGERIWLESTSESNTTFTFSLPLPPTLET